MPITYIASSRDATALPHLKINHYNEPDRLSINVTMDGPTMGLLKNCLNLDLDMSTLINQLFPGNHAKYK